MGTPVRWSLSFQAEYEALEDDDPRRDEVMRLSFALTNTEPDELPSVRETMWPWGGGWVDGYEVDLEDGRGFVGFAPLTDPKTGEPIIGMLHLIVD